MIASLRGVVVERDAETVVLESAGVGREVHLTASAAARLPAPGGEAFVLVVPSYAMYGGGETLYGFLDAAEKAMFCAFRDEIPGTGAKKALEYLDKASKSLPDFRRAVLERDEKLLCGVFGFSKKTAAKIIGALKDKLEDVRVSGAPHLRKLDDALPATGAWSQALSALEALGYKPAEVRGALRAMAEEHAGRDLPAEQLVRQALKKL
jgi:Holliday junction DNA helicase RuvA